MRTFISIFLLLLSLIWVTDIPAQNWQSYKNEIDQLKRNAAEHRQAKQNQQHLQKVEQEQNSGIRGALGFQEILGSDYRAQTLINDPNQSNGRTEKEPMAPSIPSCRAFPSMRNTASLNDLFFLNAQFGWTVGDRGTIWMTKDGGSHWFLVNFPSDVNLYSVHFQNEQLGIVVGGLIESSSQTGRGSIFRTEDGGRTWQSVEIGFYPILRKVRFCGPNQVWISGDSSELYPGGLFISGDGGLSWTAEAGSRHSGWRTLIWNPTTKEGMGIGMDGSLIHKKGGARIKVELPVGARRILDLSEGSVPQPLYISGQAGLLMQSLDKGAHWTRVVGNKSADQFDYFDFQTIFVREKYLWMAGLPGSVIFFSKDGGATWNSAFTGVRVPLRKIWFSDENNGWAVGDLGTIIASKDGGRTWKIMREGGRRLTFLALWGNGSILPWEMFALYAGEEGFLTRLHLLARDDDRETISDELTWNSKLQEALLETGADGVSESGLFRLDSRDLNCTPEQIIERFNRENDGKGLEKFRENLVRFLRLWRPSIVIIEEGSASPMAALIEKELPLAIQKAADPLAWSEHLTWCRLEPWQVQKVLRFRTRTEDRGESGLSPDSGSNVSSKKKAVVDSSFFCTVLGRSSGELGRKARLFVGVDPHIPKNNSFDIIYDREKKKENEVDGKMDSNTGYSDILAGMDIPPGSEARRIPEDGLRKLRNDLVKRSMDRRKKLGIVDTLFNKKETNATAAGLLARLGDLQKGMDSEQAIEFLLSVGNSLAGKGEWELAEEVYSSIAMDYANCSASREAFLWLISFYSSRELYWKTQEKNRAAQSVVYQMGGGASPAEARNRSGLAIDPVQLQARLANADNLGKMIRDTCPELFMDPRIRFPLASVQRERGFTNDALRYYMNRSMISGNDLWGIRAMAEYWLLTPNRDNLPPGNRVCPLSSVSCRAVVKRPYLDGVLETEIWSAAERISLSKERLTEPSANPDRDKGERTWQTENKKLSKDFGSFISFLYDKEYLYIGIECQKIVGFPYRKEDLPRERDSDLSAFDRIEIELDADRDYATAWSFVIDYRGWARESLWNDIHWDPRVFIAHKEDEKKWTLEIAIPWEELVQQPPLGSEVWALAIRRVVPGIGFECWNVDNSEKGKNGFGFLSFGF